MYYKLYDMFIILMTSAGSVLYFKINLWSFFFFFLTAQVECVEFRHGFIFSPLRLEIQIEFTLSSFLKDREVH